jgi:hypothetical protein
VFPKCLGGDQATHVARPDSTDLELLSKQPLDYMGIWSVAYALPKFEKRDDYESTKNFRIEVGRRLNNWALGDFKPDTRLVVGKSLDSYDSTYDPDRQLLTINVPFGETSAILATRHSSSDEDLDGIRAVHENDFADGLWFVNRRAVADPKIDGTCAPHYPAPSEKEQLKISMPPELAKEVRDKLRVLFVVSFAMPRSVSVGEWCYVASRRGDGDAFLIKGGAMEIGSSTDYVNVTLNRVIVAAGNRVLFSKIYS